MRGGISGERERRPNWFCIKMSLPGGPPPPSRKKSGHSMSSNLKSLGGVCRPLAGGLVKKERERERESGGERGGGG